MGIDSAWFNRLYEEVDHRIEVFILEKTMRVKRGMGFDWGKEYDQLALLESKLRRFVVSLEIDGNMVMPMYDDQPIDFASFTSDRSSSVGLGTLSLPQALALVTEPFITDAWDEFCADWDEGERGDIYHVKLVDSVGDVVMVGELRGGAVKWEDLSALEKSDLDAMSKKAAELSTEASEESRWDNHDTSRRLSREANKLLAIVKAASAVQKLTHFTYA